MDSLINILTLDEQIAHLHNTLLNSYLHACIEINDYQKERLELEKNKTLCENLTKEDIKKLKVKEYNKRYYLKKKSQKDK